MKDEKKQVGQPPFESSGWLSRRREPFTFMLQLTMLGSVILFVFIVLAYLIRRQDENWSNVTLPRIFWLSTAFMLVSSATLFSAVQAFRKEHFLNYRIMLSLTFALGIAFSVFQFMGWSEMFQRGIALNTNVAGAFIYILSGLHVLHVVIGIFFLGRLVWDALHHHKYLDAYIYSVNPPNQLRLKLLSLYWHFVDILWIFLFIFLVYNHRK